MKRSYQLWILALMITAASAVLQRLTGPSYPKHYVTLLDGKAIEVILERSHGGDDDHIISVETRNPNISGRIEWKRYNTNDAYSGSSMTYSDGMLIGTLPHQPPAGKLHYTVYLSDGNQTFSASTVIRFRGDVPAAVLIIHIAAMFGAMLLSARTGLEIFTKEPSYRKLTYFTFGLVTFGGMVMGPAVLHYAFNEWWTGFPFGSDITDNKTLIAFLAWMFALISIYRSSRPQRWILAASVITFIVFLIPHSLWGTELDYSTMQLQK